MEKNRNAEEHQRLSMSRRIPDARLPSLLGSSLPAELGDLGRSPKDDCCKHMQGRSALHTDTVGNDGVSFTD